MLSGIVVRNSTVIDGSGGPAFKADVLIKGDRIVEIGRIHAPPASFIEIDASRCIVTPGFIDLHSHSDLQLLNDPFLKKKIGQGITTEVLGNCGFSVFPLTDRNMGGLDTYIEPILGQSWCGVKWSGLEGYYEILRETSVSTNVATYVGHNTLRAAVMGVDSCQGTSKEIRAMETLLRQAIEDGAVGLSTGLLYVPGCYARKEEIVDLCRIVGSKGGYYTTHMRNESNKIEEAIEESLEIGRMANVSVHISHLKVMGKNNWGKTKEILKILQEARDRGERVTCDVYPYLAGSSSLTAIFPPWVLEGGAGVGTNRLKEYGMRDRVKKEWENTDIEWENVVGNCGWENILISAVRSSRNKQYEGKTIKQISDELRKDPADIALDLWVQEQGKLSMINFGMAEEDMVNILRYPFSCIGTDGLYGGGKPHPRLCGTFPKILGTYVREKGILTWEEAIRKMTHLPAHILGIPFVGRIKEGYFADLVVLDPDKITDGATYTEPCTPPVGIEYVLVSGRVVFQKGEFTGERPGRILKKRDTSKEKRSANR